MLFQYFGVFSVDFTVIEVHYFSSKCAKFSHEFISVIAISIKFFFFFLIESKFENQDLNYYTGFMNSAC